MLLSESLSGDDEEGGDGDGELFRLANWVITGRGGSGGRGGGAV